MLDEGNSSDYDLFLEQLKGQGMDVVKKKFLNSIGALLLIMDGFDFRNGFAHPQRSAMAKEKNSWHRITPTWKPLSSIEKGPLEFDYKASGENALQAMHIGFDGQTVAELADFLESKFNVAATDYNERQVRMMFQFTLRPGTSWVPAEFSTKVSIKAVFGFSFAAAGKTCKGTSPDDCPHPGRANAMLGDTTLAYLQHNSDVHAICQWEIVTAMMKARPGKAWQEFEKRVHMVGAPGIFKSTVQVLKDMLTKLRESTQGSMPSSIAVLAHPDHLPRAYITVRSAFAESSLRKILGNVLIIPAMLPCSLGWPNEKHDGLVFSMFSGKLNSAWFEGNGLTHDEKKGEDVGLGYFEDGDQHWTYDRQNFLLYELWARAKTFATGGLTWPTTWPVQGHKLE